MRLYSEAAEENKGAYLEPFLSFNYYRRRVRINQKDYKEWSMQDCGSPRPESACSGQIETTMRSPRRKAD